MTIRDVDTGLLAVLTAAAAFTRKGTKLHRIRSVRRQTDLPLESSKARRAVVLTPRCARRRCHMLRDMAVVAPPAGASAAHATGETRGFDISLTHGRRAAVH